MWRFSLPVGLLFTLIFVSILIYSLKKKFFFLHIGIWIAFLISLGMDYSLLGREFTLTFFYFYMIFFLPNTKEQISELEYHKKASDFYLQCAPSFFSAYLE